MKKGQAFEYRSEIGERTAACIIQRNDEIFAEDQDGEIVKLSESDVIREIPDSEIEGKSTMKEKILMWWASKGQNFLLYAGIAIGALSIASYVASLGSKTEAMEPKEAPKPTMAEELTIELNELNTRKAPELVRLKSAKDEIQRIEKRQKEILEALNSYRK